MAAHDDTGSCPKELLNKVTNGELRSGLTDDASLVVTSQGVIFVATPPGGTTMWFSPMLIWLCAALIAT